MPSFRWNCGIVAGRDALAFDPRLDAPDLARCVGRERVAIHERLDKRQESLAELPIARHRARSQQRLELPRESPTLVVLAVPADGPRQDPVLAFGAEVGVDAEGLALGGRRTDLGHQVGGDLVGDGEVALGLAAVHEQHIDVGLVRQLASTEPPHPDDGERHRRIEHAQRGLDARVGEVGELARGHIDGREPEHVARRDAQELATLESAETDAAGR